MLINVCSRISASYATVESMKSLIYINLFALSLWSCTQEVNEQDRHLTGPTTVNEVDSTVFTVLEFNPGWYWVFKNAKPATLNSEDLAEIEKILQRSIADNNQEERKRLQQQNLENPENQRTETGYEIDDLSRYRRQYVPVINEKGEKVVWVNLFCNYRSKEDWRTDIVMTSDGGNCFFELKVNLTTKTYSDFYVNGYA